MKKLKIADGIHMLTMNVDKILFEGMWELANGVTLNSYIVQGEKTAIVDGVIGWDGIPETLYKNLEEIGVDPQSIEYLIVNHMEPDHSGWISNFRKIKDNFTVICTDKAAKMVSSFYGEENIRVVKEGDTLDLGNGKVLSFHTVPNVHWPDTMYTYEQSTKTLFSCDMFGSFGTIADHCFDDELTPEEIDFFESEAIRYYSNVMGTFTASVKKAIDKAKTLDVKTIAPGHGIVYRSNPQKVMDNYIRYAKYSEGAGKNEVTILWGSMYGMTGKAVEYVEKVLQREGVKYNKLEMPLDTESEMVATVFKSAGIIVAAPTYEYKLFPPVATALNEVGRKRITGKTAFRFGSYGWSGGAEKELVEINERNRMNWQFIESVEFEGAPKDEDLAKVEAGVLELLEKIKDKVVE
ncbi:MAG: FprA family A-type flavoprotein [Clostridiales bacterium]|uniref:FprA family A-type flavoprotein n=1 Tax=Clostridium sp. N3C TaxID=1776758 RepID=UPI00092E1740|nr:FprA family A-type flavoprotein [Clostridium sp. N3C]NLZ48605.1 FprA family A-type flavoprotein [Clostridiales bacterium]SCN23999.1 Nitric oxide reductase [Clostridium sp. N3C]